MSVDIPCNCPLPPNNGYTSTCSGYVSTGYKLSYHCSNTHRLAGVQSRTCQGNGTWTGSRPTCISSGSYRVSCHQQKFSQLSAETTLALDCVIFHHTGCPCPSAPENGYTGSCSVYDSYYSYVYYYCNSGYTLYGGDSRRTCRYDGTWSGIAPSCYIQSEHSRLNDK